MRSRRSLIALAFVPFASCTAQDETCRIVAHEDLPASTSPLSAEVVVDGLDVPWSIAFLPEGGLLVTERGGALRLVEGDVTLGEGELVAEPVLTLPVAGEGEGGLLGVALDPSFPLTRRFFLYRTAADLSQNTIERFFLDDDARGAESERVVLGGIPAARNHDGGRLRIGPDGNLWATTGDAQDPERSRDDDSLGGKVLRMTLEGEPVDGSLVAVKGVRNGQGLAFLDGFDADTPESGRLVVTDHGPSGELARVGHDEIDVVAVGEDLGWPEAHACDAVEGVRAPLLVFDAALPPGGVAIFEGKAFVTALGAEKLVEIDLETGDAVVHLDGTFGRLRDIVVGPDGALWVTTSNCDGRGDCPDDGDVILRLSR